MGFVDPRQSIHWVEGPLIKEGEPYCIIADE